MVPPIESLPEPLLQGPAPASMRLKDLFWKSFGLVVQRHEAVGACMPVLGLQTDAKVQVLETSVDVTLISEKEGQIIVGLCILPTRLNGHSREANGVRHSAHGAVDGAEIFVGEVHLAVHLECALEALHGCLDVAESPVNDAQVVVGIRVSWIKMNRELVVDLRLVPLLFFCIKHAQVKIEVGIPGVEGQPLLQGFRSLFQLLSLQVPTAQLQQCNGHVFPGLTAVLVDLQR
mmetsp:Transcript_44866/g.104812  ORF Transcript_44866/g.104812 Transcript_44866/m.104812 type:complete len:232 (+) Transcript_44866:1233-1928(+)